VVSASAGGPVGGVYDIAEEAGFRHGVPAGIMSRLVARESGGNPAARGLAGELGLCQFMPATWGEWGRGDWRDPAANADAAARYLAWLKGQVGDWWRAAAAYNWGIGRVMQTTDDRMIPASVAAYADAVAGTM
jgi:soluble lytic murein transglycosylase-like protein